MSKRHLSLITKLFVFTLLFFIFCAFETSFWPFVLNILPAPQLWLIMIVFIALKWPLVRAVFFSYFLGLILTRFSYIPLKMSWTTLLALVMFVWFFKTRFHSTSLFYFSILVSSSSLFYAMIFILTSHWLEPNPTSILFFDRILAVGCNFLFSIPTFKLLDFLNDRFASSERWEFSANPANQHPEVEQ